MGSDIVPAVCTNCGGTLMVNANQDAAVCSFCKTPFIIKKAIETYNIKNSGNLYVNNATIVNGPSAENYVKRAKQFLEDGNIEKALEYYDKALDLDADYVPAKDRIKDIKTNEYLKESRTFSKKGEIAQAIRYLNSIKETGFRSARIDEEIEHLKSLIYGKILFDKDAYYRFSMLQIAASEVRVVFDSKEFKICGPKETISIPSGVIDRFELCENSNYAGETFGRTKPNCVRLIYFDTKKKKQEKIDVRFHEAEVIVEKLKQALKSIKIYGSDF